MSFYYLFSFGGFGFLYPSLFLSDISIADANIPHIVLMVHVWQEGERCFVNKKTSEKDLEVAKDDILLLWS